ncbi:Oidioi.mRNA.OKI2018_I69.XSR.g13934.t1.cds [Oikopleura dioica]|uniref:Oidioi.mRNA.OKI2018_I69.XSR.g13934.t1.cds n=1 Tax=Oikopleura dioica TaxID=34765 RepID=A0ABN7S8C3_OIKDI|nr:Oidioi.mRNA.OKI2018_I69.XSR.g13934.t1.cds [Oikopleura dioica]
MIRSGLIFALLAGCAQASRRSQRAARAVIVITGNFTEWECGNCTESCGYEGTRTCVRECVDSRHGSGEDELNAWIDDPYADEFNKQIGDEYDIVCESDADGQLLEKVDNCPDNDPCPTWGEWTDSGCPVTCGVNATKIQTRDCLVGDVVVDAALCPPGEATQEVNCGLAKCPSWGEWGPWSDCTAECGGGTTTRERDCTNARKHRTYYQELLLIMSGRADLVCDGLGTEEAACNTDECTYSCGDITDSNAYPWYPAIAAKATVECKHNDYCTVSCADGKSTAYPDASDVTTAWDGQIHCNEAAAPPEFELNPAEVINFMCQDLPCDDGAGAEIVDFPAHDATTADVVCDAGACAINCLDDTHFPQPAASIDCTNFLANEAFLTNKLAKCTESACGLVEDDDLWTGLASLGLEAACDATSCNISCSDATMIAVENAAEKTDAVTCGASAWDLSAWSGAGVQCQILACDAAFDPTTITKTEGATLNCAGGQCAVECPGDLHPSVAAITCDNKDSVTAVSCQELSCGDQDSFSGDFADGTYNCNSTADFCTAECTDATLVPYPADGVSCDNGAISPAGAVTCEITGCGDPANFNYGAGWSEVTATCSDANTCALSCDGDATKAFSYPVDEVTCIDRTLTPASGNDIYCAETPCGLLGDFYNVDATGLTTSCTADSCDLTCAAGQMSTYLTLACDSANRAYQHAHSSETQQVACVAEYDTPCGQVEDSFTMVRDDFTITCTGLESFYQTTAVSCDVTCANANNVQTGPTSVTCENSAYTGAGAAITCMDTNCGDVSSTWTVEAGVEYECVDDVCTFTCTDASLVPTFDTATCQADLSFAAVVLYPDSVAPVTPTSISCAAPIEHTVCGDPTAFFVNLPADSTFSCVEASQECNIICDTAVYGDAVQADPVKISCNPSTGLFVEAADIEMECSLYDVTCGNLEDFFGIGAGVVSTCVKFGEARQNLDVCTMTCSDASLFAYPYEVIRCDIDTELFVENTGVNVTCEETRCGDPKNFDYGAGFKDIDVSCDVQADATKCSLTCAFGANAGFVIDTAKNPFAEVICDNTGTLMPESGSVEIVCAETPCGQLATEFVGFSVDASCNATYCDFSCADPAQMPSYFNAACDGTSYTHVFGSESNALTCIPKQDSPCGNLADTFTYDPAAIDLGCEAFVSVYQTTPHVCAPSCVDTNKVLVTDAEITCEANAFTNTLTDIMCKDTMCGDLSDKWTVEAGVVATCTESGCEFSCEDAAEQPFVSSITCDVATRTFEDVVLWPDSASPVTNPVIKCEVRDDTPCGNAADFTNLLNDTVINCDWDTATCQVICDQVMYENHQPNIELITCDVSTEQFNYPFDQEFNCNLYDVTCGDLEDSFTFDDDVSYTCEYFKNARNVDLDVCTLTCASPDEKPYPIDKIECIQSTKQFLTQVGQHIECIPPPETDCGYVSDQYNLLDSAGKAICDETTGICYFECADPTHYNPIPRVECLANGNYYPNVGGTIGCYPGYDTACGNIETTGNSIKACANNTCEYTCEDATDFLHGVTTATCTVIEGVVNVDYAANLHISESSTMESTCGETMCGDVSSIAGQFSEDVQIDLSMLDADGYGKIMLGCNGTVISGLKGHTAIACLATSGNFDLVDPEASVACSATTCGDPSDVLSIGEGVIHECSDADICYFSCDAEEGSSVAPTMDELICQTLTGEFLNGFQTSVKCLSGCDDFGPETGYITSDPLLEIECPEYTPGEMDQYCHLICRLRNEDGTFVPPRVKETGQELRKVQCYKPGAMEGFWRAVYASPYGVPIYKKIEGEGVRTIICEAGEAPTQPPVKSCGPVRETYNIDEDNMQVRCTDTNCGFKCDPGYKLNKGAPTNVICLAAIDEGWSPNYPGQIRCEKAGNGGEVEEPEDDCGSPNVKLGDNVVEDCSGNRCDYSCSNGGDPTASKLDCKGGKWIIEKNIKRRASNALMVMEGGVLAQCSAKQCSFTCADGNSEPSKDTVKCKCKKGKCNWDISKKETISCGGAKSATTTSSGKPAKAGKAGKKDKKSKGKSTAAASTTSTTSTEAVSEESAPEEAPVSEAPVEEVAQRVLVEADTGCDTTAFGPDVAFTNCAGGKNVECEVVCLNGGSPSIAVATCNKKFRWEHDSITCA